MRFPINSERLTALGVFVVTLLIYGLSAGRAIIEQSGTPYYVHLANSFLHGHLDLVSLPKGTYDLISYRGRWFVAGGPTSALLLVPFVALFGTDLSDVCFGVVVGALNAALLYIMLAQVTAKRDLRLWLTILFAFGTVHWNASTVGTVWLNAQVVAVLFMMLYANAALQSKAGFAGVFLGFAALSRPPVMFSAIFFLLLIFFRETDRRLAIRKTLTFGFALCGPLVVMLAYNALRFGSPFDFGYANVQGSFQITNAYAVGGGFSLKYLPCNIYVSIFGMPNIAGNPLPSMNSVCSHLGDLRPEFEGDSGFFNPIGMSIFVTTPFFLLIFQAPLREKLVAASWLGMMATVNVDWLYQNPGWVQFGYRYTLDVIVFLFILLGYAVHRMRLLELGLLLWSVIMGGIGVVLMHHRMLGWFWSD